ncbi:RNA polymerase sigma factor [Solirubrobacter ginsenosidimutans]|uniref:RNA polymerase sigma factor n=1 Tax=Solirubrobacter ginsenosidimutans TaxID=490573 RepID=A0A9X3RZK3_9ACTN|nr:RNA polymerase sigma factor [Solirubrobacter ginsenosidimutans]MDA0160289.1 RNA polymerase sigma factor [Solirubrobacter ginsenosidimutans]
MRRRFRILGSPSTSLLVQSLSDVEVFASFYRAYYDGVLSFLVRRVFDPEIAFDLVSETFAKALERRRQFRGDTAEQEQAWLFAIARTELSHYWRSGKTERAAIQRYSIAVPALTEAETDRIEAMAGLAGLGDELADALSELPPDHRLAVELRVIKELSYAELAAELGVSEPTARARVSRGLRTLALHISAEDVNALIGDTA